MRIQISTNVSRTTRRQADELIKERDYTLRDVVTIGVRMLHQEEFGMSIHYDVDFHDTNVAIGDKVRLIKIQRYYTNTPHWSGENGPKVGDIRISYGFIASDEPHKLKSDYQDVNCVISSWDEGGFEVEKMERINYDILRVWIRPINDNG